MLGKIKTGKLIGELPQGKDEILYFDTEQGEYDSFNVIKRIEHMAGNIDKMRAFNLRPNSPKERCEMIESAFKLYGEKNRLFVLSMGLQTWLMRLTTRMKQQE